MPDGRKLRAPVLALSERSDALAVLAEAQLDKTSYEVEVVSEKIIAGIGIEVNRIATSAQNQF